MTSLPSQPTTSRAGALLAMSIARPLPLFSTRLPHPLSNRSFSTSKPREISHFDTYLFVDKLEKNGMTRKQAEGVMSVLAEVVEESIKGMESGLVSKAEQEKQRYTEKVDFARLKSELQLHEKNDLSLMKAENDRLMADVEKLKQRLREEVTRTQAGVRLDLNLEKGRIRDESSQQELKIKEVDTRIESEIAGLRTQIEQAKFSILQYLVGVATGSGALLLAYMRMMVSFNSLSRFRTES
ncbi:mitochondrial protein [Kwoniella mangroviensis CBS 10435]|uniref:Mitochondrial protein n=1 Tax=Kwoniella mangroviensis CBS 10435 TaxID=1331196 RepID=A0A1B9ILK8_9TREE|nr:mitochondrial protein [Kwoniella mangroviensis CBS 10435]